MITAAAPQETGAGVMGSATPPAAEIGEKELPAADGGGEPSRAEEMSGGGGAPFQEPAAKLNAAAEAVQTAAPVVDRRPDVQPADEQRGDAVSDPPVTLFWSRKLFKSS